MRVAILTESEADQAAIGVFVQALAGPRITVVEHDVLRTRGWPSVRHVLPQVIRSLYQAQLIEGLVVVVDSNGSPAHSRAHEDATASDPECRLCQLRRVVAETQLRIARIPSRPHIQVALGLTVPCIEAWYQFGQSPNANEAHWCDFLLTNPTEGAIKTAKNRLKQQSYGTSRVARDTAKRRAIEEATAAI